MIRGIIFDLDGVLVHTDELHFDAWSRIARELDVPFDRAANERLRGVGRRDCLDILLERYHGTPLSEHDKQILCDRKNDLYRALLSALSPSDVPEETRRVLRTLRARGLKTAVGSSSRSARLILAETQLDALFDAVADGGDAPRSKPAPDIFLRAADMLGLDASDCAVVEDAPAGITAARAAGMTAIGLGTPARLGEAGPEYMIRSLPELLPLPIFPA